MVLHNANAGQVMGPAPRLVAAMVLKKMGRDEEAQSTLAAAEASFNWNPEIAKFPGAWIYPVLRREADAMITPGAASLPATQAAPLPATQAAPLPATQAAPLQR